MFNVHLVGAVKVVAYPYRAIKYLRPASRCRGELFQIDVRSAEIRKKLASFASHHAYPYMFLDALVPSRNSTRTDGIFAPPRWSFHAATAFSPGPRNPVLPRRTVCVTIATCGTPVQRQSLIQGNSCSVYKARDYYAACEVWGATKREREDCGVALGTG